MVTAVDAVRTPCLAFVPQSVSLHIDGDCGPGKPCITKMSTPAYRRGGFTLVEILIVVMILGVMAAIVMPQFTNASQDAKRNSLTSTLHALRSQLELYQLQHGDTPATLSGSDWSSLTDQSTFNGQAVGPYLTLAPSNPLNGFSDVLVVSADAVGGDAVSTPRIGFVFNSTNGKLWGTNSKGDKVYNEVNPLDPNN